jgi:hypothetical protein
MAVLAIPLSSSQPVTSVGLKTATSPLSLMQEGRSHHLEGGQTIGLRDGRLEVAPVGSS